MGIFAFVVSADLWLSYLRGSFVAVGSGFGPSTKVTGGAGINAFTVGVGVGRRGGSCRSWWSRLGGLPGWRRCNLTLPRRGSSPRGSQSIRGSRRRGGLGRQSLLHLFDRLTS